MPRWRPTASIAHARRSHADEHFHEVGTRNGEERNACFARDRLREQRFTRARRAYEQHALRNARAEVGELAGAFEELDHFGKLLLLLFRSRHVGEPHFDVGIDAGLGLGKAHRLASPALRLPDQQPEHHAHQYDTDERDEVVHKTARIRVGERHSYGVAAAFDRLVEHLLQRVAAARAGSLVAGVRFIILARIDVAVDLHPVDFPVLYHLTEFGKIDTFRCIQRAGQYDRQDQYQHHGDNAPDQYFRRFTHSASP